MTFYNTSFLKELYSDENQIKYRGEFIKNYSNRKESIRSIILKILPKINNKNILDVGCGDCSFLKKINIIYPNNNLNALDIVSNENCKNNSIINYKLYEGKNIPDYKQKFDIVFCLNVLYHIENKIRFLKSIKNLISSNSCIVITTKSNHNLLNIEKIFRNIIRSLKINNSRLLSHHYKTFSLQNGKSILKKVFDNDGYSIKVLPINTQMFIDNKHDLLKYILSTPRYNIQNYTANTNLINQYIEQWDKRLGTEIFIDNCKEVIYFIKNK
jgi:2-polyprenyl-3-methyl-5-hydroxy-6-metoxy-1,4-benzoquinol methylase